VKNTAPALAFWRQFKGLGFAVITTEQIVRRVNNVCLGVVADRSSVTQTAQVAKLEVSREKQKYASMQTTAATREAARLACAGLGLETQSVAVMKEIVRKWIMTLGELLSDPLVSIHPFAGAVGNDDDECHGWITKNVDPAWM